MGRGRLSRDAYSSVRLQATAGGTQSATHVAEEKARKGKGMDPLVDPKGPPHLGPIRRSLPRFEKQGKLWLLTCGMPMPEETALDTTGSMGNNVDDAFGALPKSYEMETGGDNPVLGRYDVQIATANFNDVEDGEGTPVLCRTQFEMAEKIAQQMTLLVPGRNGCGNRKEDSHFAIFAAGYLTAARINEYGLKWYHFLVSDEPTVLTFNFTWLKRIFGDDVLDHVRANGFNFTEGRLPDTAQAVCDLQKKAHAFFLQVNDRSDVRNQWRDLYGADHAIMLPRCGTKYLHCVKASIIGLTEGVLDIEGAEQMLRTNASADEARQIMRAIAHIPIGAQTLAPNFHKLPKAGDFFKEKTDLWPIAEADIDQDESLDSEESAQGAQWL